MRALLLALLVVGCGGGSGGDDDDSAGGALTGDCALGAIHCVDPDTIQYCDGGTWGFPQPCEPMGEPPTQIRTICQEDVGACSP